MMKPIGLAAFSILATAVLIAGSSGTSEPLAKNAAATDAAPESTLAFATPSRDLAVSTAAQTAGKSNGVKAVAVVNCGDQACFDRKWAACEPATLKPGPGMIAAVEYTIVGPDAEGCKVTMIYFDNPDPETPQKAVTCIYAKPDRSKRAIEDLLVSAIKGDARCDGPLDQVLSHPAAP